MTDPKIYVGGIALYSLSQPALYRWLDQQDDGLHDLPDDREFLRLGVKPPRRLARLRKKLGGLLRATKNRARHYALKTLQR